VVEQASCTVEQVLAGWLFLGLHLP